VFVFTHDSLLVGLARKYPTTAALTIWAVGLLSYHQDAKHHDQWWAILSQILATVCVLAIIVFALPVGSGLICC
jgi:hypothetical protein